MTGWTKDSRYASHTSYFSCIWYLNDRMEFDEDHEFVVLRVRSKYYVSPVNEYTNKKDIGPFSTLTEAKAVAETLMLLQTSVDDLSTSST